MIPETSSKEEREYAFYTALEFLAQHVSEGVLPDGTMLAPSAQQALLEMIQEASSSLALMTDSRKLEVMMAVYERLGEFGLLGPRRA